MKKILLSILAVVMCGVIAVAPLMVSESAFAKTQNCVETTFFGEVCDSEGISNVLKLVIRVFTIAVGVLAAVGISIVGVQYLTAGANEEQTRKAKRRLFEIVIGIVAFVLIYAVLTWLLPGFKDVWS